MFSFCFSRVGYSCFERLALTDFRDLSVGMKDTSWYSVANCRKGNLDGKDCIRDAFDFATRDPFNLAVTNKNTDLWLWCFGYFWLSYVKGDLYVYIYMYIYIYLYMDTMLHDRSWVTQRRFRKHRTLDAMIINHFLQNPRIFTQKKGKPIHLATMWTMSHRQKDHISANLKTSLSQKTRPTPPNI